MFVHESGLEAVLNDITRISDTSSLTLKALLVKKASVRPGIMFRSRGDRCILESLVKLSYTLSFLLDFALDCNLHPPSLV